MRRVVSLFLAASLMFAVLVTTSGSGAQSVTATAAAPPSDPWCTSQPASPFCHAVRGVRASGWPAQSRSEVMAANGMVVTSQPLAAQSGLQVLMRGGNAIDAAVATAGMLSLTEPMMVGVASDLFAVIYIAKEHKVYVLNASGIAPTGASAFGSGITVPGYGFVLHNRGTLFTLDPKSPNVIAPHKRPFNTLSAGFLMRDGQPVMTVTLMGGDMQAQGHAQLLVNIIDLGANVQAAADMARFRHSEVSNRVSLESSLYELVGSALTAMGHAVQSVSGADLGGVQVIQRVSGDASLHYYRGASDFRKDGEAVGW